MSIASRIKETLKVVVIYVVGLAFLSLLGISLIQEAIYRHDQAGSLSLVGEVGLMAVEVAELGVLVLVSLRKARRSYAKSIAIVLTIECIVTFGLLVTLGGFPFL
jgi:hypothetical protein